MPRISIRGNTLYYREPEHTEVVGVVDGEDTLWLKEIPNGQALCRGSRYIGLRDKRIMNHVRRWQLALRFKGADCRLTAAWNSRR